MKRSPFILLLLLTFFLGCSTTHEPDAPAALQEPLKVFLVRHAEKVDSSRDPDLSESGYQRAATLAKVLRNTNIEHIHSSDYIRTRKTAAPIAELYGLEVELYDPRSLEAFAEELKNEGGVHVVVGHSNTTPTLTGLLGGDQGTPINDAGEYDRLYIVDISANGSVNSTMLRYGEKYGEE